MPTTLQPRHRRRHTAAQRRVLLERFTSSGLTLREFCRREGLSLSSLQRWRALAGDSPRAAAFVELVPRPPAGSPSDWLVELTLPNGVSLRLRG